MFHPLFLCSPGGFSTHPFQPVFPISFLDPFGGVIWQDPFPAFDHKFFSNFSARTTRHLPLDRLFPTEADSGPCSAVATISSPPLSFSPPGAPAPFAGKQPACPSPLVRIFFFFESVQRADLWFIPCIFLLRYRGRFPPGRFPRPLLLADARKSTLIFYLCLFLEPFRFLGSALPHFSVPLRRSRNWRKELPRRREGLLGALSVLVATQVPKSPTAPLSRPFLSLTPSLNGFLS